MGAQRAPVDLLLTDVVMPGMNGRELYEELRRSYPSLKVLYMSGYPADVIGKHGVLDKGVHMLRKPFSTQELAEKVREALDGGQAAQ
jgi:CheY-like chemotaxis protein